MTKAAPVQVSSEPVWPKAGQTWQSRDGRHQRHVFAVYGNEGDDARQATVLTRGARVTRMSVTTLWANYQLVLK